MQNEMMPIPCTICGGSTGETFEEYWSCFGYEYFDKDQEHEIKFQSEVIWDYCHEKFGEKKKEVENPSDLIDLKIKYKHRKVSFEIIVENLEQEVSGKRILNQRGSCVGVTCDKCLFMGKDSGCGAVKQGDRFSILKEMGF